MGVGGFAWGLELALRCLSDGHEAADLLDIIFLIVLEGFVLGFVPGLRAEIPGGAEGAGRSVRGETAYVLRMFCGFFV
jgi:hypothetical protein